MSQSLSSKLFTEASKSYVFCYDRIDQDNCLGLILDPLDVCRESFRFFAPLTYLGCGPVISLLESTGITQLLAYGDPYFDEYNPSDHHDFGIIGNRDIFLIYYLVKNI